MLTGPHEGFGELARGKRAKFRHVRKDEKTINPVSAFIQETNCKKIAQTNIVEHSSLMIVHHNLFDLVLDPVFSCPALIASA